MINNHPGVTPLNLRSLDALRGFLAVYVLAGHCRWLLWTGYSNWIQHPHPMWQKLIAVATSGLRYGHEAVMIFFVLSGFFIHLRMSKKLAVQPISLEFDLPTFVRRRCHRLIPPYAFALIITFILDTIGMLLWPTLYQAATGDTLLDINFARKGYSLTSVLPALFLLPSSLNVDFGSNGPFWSLSYEIVYYAIYPIWLLLRQRGAGLAYGSGLVVSALSLAFLPGGFFLNKVLQYYPIWLCGAAFSELYTRQTLWSLLQSRNRWIIFAGGFIVAFVGLNLIDIPPINILFYALLGSSTMLLFLNLPTQIWQSPGHKLFENLGIQSYTIYIFHFPMVALVSAWVIETQGHRPSHGWLALAAVGGILLLCSLCFHICERHFLHRRLKASSV